MPPCYHCAKVRQTATKLHTDPDDTERARSQSLLQMRDSDFTTLGTRKPNPTTAKIQQKTKTIVTNEHNANKLKPNATKVSRF